MENYLAVFIGGGIGSLLRFSIANIELQKITYFPLNTLISNSLACLILGIAIGIMSAKADFISLSFKLFLITGICGGFSTYSAFTFETLELIKLEKYFLAASNVILNFVVCTVFIIAGVFVSKLFQ